MCLPIEKFYRIKFQLFLKKIFMIYWTNVTIVYKLFKAKVFELTDINQQGIKFKLYILRKLYFLGVQIILQFEI